MNDKLIAFLSIIAGVYEKPFTNHYSRNIMIFTIQNDISSISFVSEANM